MAIISDDDKSFKRSMGKNPIIKSETIEYDKTFENSIRPKDFDSYIGQSELKETLKVTLEAAKLREKPENQNKPILVFLHFPPVWNEFVCREFLDTLHEYEISRCYFGHIHGAYHVPRTTHFEGIEFVLCASDYLNFTPLPIRFDWKIVFYYEIL